MEFDYSKFYGYLMQFFFPLAAILTGLFIWATYPAMLKKMSSSSLLLGREKEIKRLVNKIRTGQSGAIIGIFGQERTEILTCLRDSNLYGHEANNLVFSYVDISTLEPDCTPEQFWKKALEPLSKKMSLNGDLDKLFEQVKQTQSRLVLLLDRFHDIVHKPNLTQTTFLGKVRSLSTSVYPSPLCLIITAHKSLGKLHQEITQEMNYSTSPFFNFMDVGEITLGALSESDRDNILKRLKLPKKAQLFIKNEVGRHPYLLRITTNRLTEACQAHEENPVEVTKQYFNQQCKALLKEMLPTWTSKMCQVFVQIVQGAFNHSDDYTEELEELEKQGLIKQEHAQWQVLSPVFVKLLKEQDTPELCSKKSL